ncbi:helix-turn-helix domain-containing protein [Eisenbergiella porci]
MPENCSIRQAAEACGFSNRAHFYRMFRRFVEYLPSMEAKA